MSMTLEEAQRIFEEGDTYVDFDWGRSDGRAIVDGHPTLEELKAIVMIWEARECTKSCRTTTGA